MSKIELGNKGYLYPYPTVLVGANVNGKPYYLNVSYCGIVNRIPAMISISLNRYHYTCNGINQNNTFSAYEFNYYSVGEKIGKAWDVGKNIEIDKMVSNKIIQG